MENTTYSKIENDLKDAMRARDQEILGTLRMLVAAVKNKKIEIGRDLNEEEVIAALKSEVKKRKDSIESYKSGNREDLAEKEQAEIEILSKYLPEQMGDEEVKAAVKKVAEEMNATKADFGKVMGKVIAELKGKADGAQVSRIVKEILG
jgi:uncharacterized protein